ncbi:MAG: DUF5343 domain-containing protein [Lachnospiraceae bacterium]|jgi:hypothetical protein|nr:DUF5343 domain-containing protein [Lachnospiraceae bacterium]
MLKALGFLDEGGQLTQIYYELFGSVSFEKNCCNGDRRSIGRSF